MYFIVVKEDDANNYNTISRPSKLGRGAEIPIVWRTAMVPKIQLML